METPTNQPEVKHRKTELEFLKGLSFYCDEMFFEVGHSILDDFNKIIKRRIKELEENAPNQSPLSNVPNRMLEKVVPSQDKIEDNFHTQINKEIEKDYELVDKKYGVYGKCVKENRKVTE